MCQEEDVLIDDISVVIIELDFLEPFKEIVNEKRKGLDELSSLVSISDSGRMMAGKREDAVRGSFVPAREVARRRIDPKRGSYVYENEKSREETIFDLTIKEEDVTDE